MVFYICCILFSCFFTQFIWISEPPDGNFRYQFRPFFYLCHRKQPVIGLIVHFPFLKTLTILIARPVKIFLNDPCRSIFYRLFIKFGKNQLCCLLMPIFCAVMQVGIQLISDFSDDIFQARAFPVIAIYYLLHHIFLHLPLPVSSTGKMHSLLIF